MGRRGPPPTKRRSEMVRLAEKGWTQRAIAERFGIHQSSVWRMLQREKAAQ